MVAVDFYKERKKKIKEVVSKAISMRDGVKESLQKRGLLKSKLVFGSNIPAIAKVKTMFANLFCNSTHLRLRGQPFQNS